MSMWFGCLKPLLSHTLFETKKLQHTKCISLKFVTVRCPASRATVALLGIRSSASFPGTAAEPRNRPQLKTFDHHFSHL